MFRSSRDFRRGDPVTSFPAADYAELLEGIQWAHSIRAAPPLDMPAPFVFDINTPIGFYAKLSGATSPYSWTELQGQSIGAWQNRVLTGTTNAYEVNSVASLNNKIVWLEPGFAGDYRFQYVGNGTGSGSGISLFGCACTSIPSTLTVTLSGPCDSIFNDCTLQYGTTPSAFSAVGLGASCFLSTASFTDAQTGLTFYYHFRCDRIFMRLSRIFVASSYSSAFEDSFIYSWSIGQSGNSCSPFALTNGTIFQGGNSTCVLTVTG
jgi:hypothetical protein